MVTERDDNGTFALLTKKILQLVGHPLKYLAVIYNSTD